MNGLGHVDINAQRRDTRYAKELGARPGGNIGANLDVSRGHDTVERGLDGLERFERLQLIYVRLVSDHGSLILLISVGCGVKILGGNDLLVLEILHTLESGLG